MRLSRRHALEEQVGQLFWIGFDGTVYEGALRSLVEEIRPGGLILFGRNIEDARQVRRLTDELFRAVPVPPFLALDQEGGRVNRLRSIVGPTPSTLSLAEAPRPTAALRRHAAASAAALLSLGFNVNLAPVLDLSDARAGNGIGDRGLGLDPGRVARLGGTVARAYRNAGVIPVGKHFPGLGSARADTHEAMPVIDSGAATLWRRDLLPYRLLAGILPIVMAGHARYPALQGDDPRPATLSPAVIDRLLRRRIGYRGLILTDDLEMGAVDQTLDGAAQALLALAAGNDALMFCRSAERIREARDGVVRALTEGRMPKERVAASARRAVALKERWLRRRARWSQAALGRARATFVALGPAAGGADPTARLEISARVAGGAATRGRGR